MKESTKKRISELGLSEAEFEPQKMPDVSAIEEQIADLTDLVTILTEVISQ